jgi:hypothetical protein
LYKYLGVSYDRCKRICVLDIGCSSPWPTCLCTIQLQLHRFIGTWQCPRYYPCLVANCIYSLCLHNHIHMHATHLWILSNPLSFWCVSGPHKCLGGGTGGISFCVTLFYQPFTNLLVLVYSQWLYAPPCCHGVERTTYKGLPSPRLGIDTGCCTVQVGGDIGGRRGRDSRWPASARCPWTAPGSR